MKSKENHWKSKEQLWKSKENTLKTKRKQLKIYPESSLNRQAAQIYEKIKEKEELVTDSNLEKIKEICEKYKLFLMEDNCDSFGSTYKNKLTGTFGDVSTLSFYPAHHITTGEGGAVVTSNTKLKKSKLIRVCSFFLQFYYPNLPVVEAITNGA